MSEDAKLAPGWAEHLGKELQAQPEDPALRRSIAQRKRWRAVKLAKIRALQEKRTRKERP